MTKNVILISGDTFLRAEKAKTLIAEFEKRSGGPLARQTFDLHETPLETVLTAARTLPFFSSGQVIHAQRAEILKEADLKLLAAYLENPFLKTTLILESEELKGAAVLSELIQSKGQWFAVGKDEARGAASAFLQQKLAPYQKTMTPGARSRILAMCGDAVIFLESMIERLVQFAGERREIDEDMVDHFEENWAEADVFKLTGALVDRDPARALKVFRDLTDLYQTDLVAIVGILHWQLRQFWQAARLLAAGVSDREVCSKLRMPSFRLNAVRRFPVERLESAVEALYQFSRKSKTGQVDGIPGLEAWLMASTA